MNTSCTYSLATLYVRNSSLCVQISLISASFLTPASSPLSTGYRKDRRSKGNFFVEKKRIRNILFYETQYSSTTWLKLVACMYSHMELLLHSPTFQLEHLYSRLKRRQAHS
jgi:hypothetical protein